MATCTECVHVEVCRYYTNELAKANGIPLKLEEVERLLECDDCENFKDRSQFIKLPCKIGDKLYFNNQHIKYARVIAIYIDASGGMFDLKIFTNVETVSGYESFINKDYTFEDIGQRIFLTREEAEQALKEREGQ